MKPSITLALLLAAAACAVAVFTIVSRSSTDASTGPAVAQPRSDTSTTGASDSAQIERLTRSVLELEGTVSELTRRVERLEEQRRDSVVAESASDAPSAPPTSSEIDPHWYLERYVASFRGEGNGDEFYRLAVQAHALELLHDIAALIRDGRRPEELRVRLTEMFGDPRFRGNERAIDTLFAALMDMVARRLPATALTALGNVGDLAVASRLTSLVWTLADDELRRQALQLIVRLYGPDANRAVQRLFATAPSEADLVFLLTLLSTTDPDTALAVIRSASLLDHAVRLAAAHKVGSFHTRPAIALIDAWLGYEREADVREVLGASRSKASTVPHWDAMQAAGPPDARPDSRDDEHAWACSLENMGFQWIELTYERPLRASSVRVIEVNVGGAVAQVIAYDEGGGQHVLWPGGQGNQSSGAFELTFAPTSFRIARLKIVLDTDKPGWNEIDAVELVGPDGRAWAAHAIASSNYGQ